MKKFKVRQVGEKFFIAREGAYEGMCLNKEELHSLFEAIGEQLGREFGAQSDENRPKGR